MDTTVAYYDQNADRFLAETAKVDFSKIQKVFVEKLPDGALILDFGCGSGRDALAFLKMGYRVEASDGSEKMCRAAEELTGIPVRQMMFQELDERERYDGIWSCASILHLPKGVLRDVMDQMCAALKTGGIIYTSFKYGSFEGERNDRYFTDFTEESFSDFIETVEELGVEKMWLTGDVRRGRGAEKWLNILLRKQTMR